MLERIKELSDKSEKAECQVERLNQIVEDLKSANRQVTDELKDTQRNLAQINEVSAPLFCSPDAVPLAGLPCLWCVWLLGAYGCGELCGESAKPVMPPYAKCASSL